MPEYQLVEKNKNIAERDFFDFVVFPEWAHECILKTQDFSNRNNQEEQTIVYHSLQIENKTQALIGKGSVFISDNRENSNRPLAQSRMDFVPVSGTGTIKLTENNEVEISRNEEIVNREEGQVKFWGRNYYKAFMEGTIKIINYNHHSIELHIDSEINGELKGDNAMMEIIGQKQPFYTPNYLSKVKWKLNLKAGETKEIKYKYEVYID